MKRCILHKFFYFLVLSLGAWLVFQGSSQAWSGEVVSFSLINADTDQPIAGFNPIPASASIYLGALPTRNLNIRANVSGKIVGVRFGLPGDSNDGRLDTIAPYALAGDVSGNFNSWTPSAGTHNLTATPLVKRGSRVRSGTSSSLGFTVVDGTAPPPPDTTPPTVENSSLPQGEVTVVLQYGRPVPGLGVTSFTGSKDTLLKAESPNAGYYEQGSAPVVTYRFLRFGLYWFDLSVLPAGVSITRARLHLYSVEMNSFDLGGSAPIFVVRSLQPNRAITWVEGSGVGFYDQYGGTSWLKKDNESGLKPRYAWSDLPGHYSTGDLSSAYQSPAAGYMNFVKALGDQVSTDLSPAIQAILNSGGRYEGLAVDRTLVSAEIRKDKIAHREYADAALRPALEITYRIGSAPPPPPSGQTAPSSYLIEHIGTGTHSIVNGYTGAQPGKSGSFIEPETGHRITRITDINEYNPLQNGNPSIGFYNGYSTYTNINYLGDYALAYNTSNSIALYGLSDCAFIHSLGVGETNDPRFDLSGRPGTEYDLYYHSGTYIKKMNVLTKASEVIYNFGEWIYSDDHMDQATRARYRPGRLSNYRVFVFDLYEKRPLQGIVNGYGYDVSPKGAFLYSDGRYFRTADLDVGNTTPFALIPTASAGHSGWAFDSNGDEVHVFQDNRNDWFSAFNPATGERIDIAHFLDFGVGWSLGQHIARIHNPLKKGWFLMATYTPPSAVGWGANNIFMVEVLPKAQSPRVWRIASTHNGPFAVGTTAKDYFAEAFANVDPSGNNIYWGANWGREDNLELYRVELPQNWHEVLAGGVVPPPLNHPPALSVPGPQTVQEGTALNFTVSAGDPDGDTVTLTASGLPTGATFSSARYDWTPDFNQAAGYVVSFTASDGSLSTTATVSITVVDVPQPSNLRRIELYAGANIPEFGISNYDGVSQNFVTQGNSALYQTATRGNYCPLASLRQDTYTWNGTTYTAQSWLDAGLVDCGELLFFDVSKLPKDLNIKRAYIGLSATNEYNEFGNHPHGQEGIPVRQILNLLNLPTPWTRAYLRPGTVGTQEANWDGASWGFSKQEVATPATTMKTYSFVSASGTVTNVSYPDNLAPWSLVATGTERWGTGPGRYGNLSTALRMLANDPRISFNPDHRSMSYSDEITELVKGWTDGSIENFGVFLDANNSSSTTYFGTSGSPNPKNRCLVGIMTNYSADPSVRPRLVIEYDLTPAPSPGPSPTNQPPVATPQSVTTIENTAKPITLAGSDPDGDPLTYIVVTQPSHGTLTGTAPTFSYTPASNYTGPDTFTFKVNDGTVDSSTVIVTIEVITIPPPVPGTDLVTLRFGEHLTSDVTGVHQDAVIKSGAQNQNYNGGSSGEHYYRWDSNILMRFDLAGIPTGARVHRALLRMFMPTSYYDGGATGVTLPLYALTDPEGTGAWAEQEVTWKNKRNGVPWSGTSGTIDTVKGASGATIYFKNWLAGGQYFLDADLTGLVQGWVDNPSSNLGVLIPEHANFNKRVGAKENTDPALRPYLEVTFEGTQTENIPLPADIRAVHHSGQTFVTWKEVVTGRNETSYKIYRSANAITHTDDLSSAELLDQVYQGSSWVADWSTDTAARQPDLAPLGITLAEDSGLYVYPVEAGSSAYYAVTTVVEGNENRDITLGVNAIVSPIEEHVGIPDAFYVNEHNYDGYYTGYVMWLGRFNPKDAADRFGFDNRRSAPVLFSISFPHRAVPSPSERDRIGRERLPIISDERFPLTIYLHSFGHGYFDSNEGRDNSIVVDSERYGGFCMNFTDMSRIVIKDKEGVKRNVSYLDAGNDYDYSYYTGWNSNYAPTEVLKGFIPTFKSARPFNEGVSVPYAEKQIRFIAEWLLTTSPWAKNGDPARVYATGASMGGWGAAELAVHHPDLISAADIIKGRLKYLAAGRGKENDRQYGSVAENIRTPGGMGIYDYMDLGKYAGIMPGLDYPSIRLLHGKNDTTIVWNHVPPFYADARAARLGIHAWFDQSQHSGGDPEAVFPERVDSRNFVADQKAPYWNIFHFSQNESYPAFTDFSLNNDPGTGDPLSGDLRGGISRYTSWERSTIVDTPSRYEITLYLLVEAPQNTATVTVTPRRLQAMTHVPGISYSWRNQRVSDGVPLQSGSVTADAAGLVSISGFEISKEPSRLIIIQGGSQ
ncbi:MAG: DNRLRE domain-containing protein [Candidatus Omnitrophica bacterium]|nr:DNRLRE domain-containing protein [Candidatus Omnitrophota bacterium]